MISGKYPNDVEKNMRIHKEIKRWGKKNICFRRLENSPMKTLTESFFLSLPDKKWPGS